MNLIICYKSVCALAGDSDSCITVFYTNDLISELSGHHPALDCISHSDLTYTYAQRDIFARIFMEGLVLTTDNSCNKFRFGVEKILFRHRMLNDNTLKKQKEKNIAKNDNGSSQVWHM